MKSTSLLRIYEVHQEIVEVKVSENIISQFVPSRKTIS